MPEQQQSGQDNSLDFLWALAFILGVLFAIWYFGKVYISSAVLHVRFYEIKALSFVLLPFSKLFQLVGSVDPQVELSQWAKYIQNNIGSDVNFSSLINVSDVVGKYIRYPFCLLMLLFASLLYFTGPAKRFKHVYSSNSLKNLEQVNWPQIAPVVNLDLVKAKLDEGAWAFSLSPMDFCKKMNLVDIEEKYGDYNVSLRRGAAHRLLSLQLGPQWSGIEYLPAHVKALFAIFAARINGDKKSSEALLDQISRSSSDISNIDFSGVDPLLRKHVSSKKVGKVVARHAYVTTVMASMLVAAREVGVLATAEFIWLKPIDRRMWYMLNTVGRTTAVSEICGAFAHWLAEKKLGLPLAAPMVEEAVNGLEVALSEVIYTPKEEE